MSFRIQQTSVPIVVIPAEQASSKVLVQTQPQSHQPSTAQLQEQIKELQSQLKELKTTSVLKIPNQDSAILLSYHSPCPSPRK